VNLAIRNRDQSGSAATQRGFAMVLVLWLIVLMSVIAAGHSRNVHVETRLAARHVDTTTSRYIAEAAVQLTILQLLSSDGVQQFDVDGRPGRLEVLGHEATVSVRQATSLVDLNTASDRLLYTTFVAAGADESSSRGLVDCILDWRDTDNLTRLHGAEDEDYRAAGLAWTARDNQFASIDELRYVMGMSKSLFEIVSPHLTIYSGQSDVERGTGNGTYYVNVYVRGKNNSLVSAEAVVSLSGVGKELFEIIEWRETSRAAAAWNEDPMA